MQIQKNLTIEGSRERRIVLDTYHISNGSAKPLIIFCHGFKGYKDWGHFELIALALAEAGFVVCKFNFSYNGGTVEQPIDFPDLEAFGHNNISTELNDLGCVIDEWVKPNAFIPDNEVDRSQICLIGHSRGGGSVILRAGEDDRVTKLVSLAAVGRIGRMFAEQSFLDHWKETGVVYIPNGRTMQQMPMYYQYYENFVANKDRLDIPAAASRINIPWLIIHGANDTTVPMDHADSLHAANAKSELLVIENGDHTFGGKHPWESDTLPDQAQQVVDATIDFLNNSKSS